ncbi:MAG: (deoxy)nucleoside triphosphate pyrophosphohydrolase [Verrucomicrobiota bacterium]
MNIPADGFPFDSTQNSKLKIKNLIEVSAGLVFRNGLLLITKRKDDVHLGGLWEFPGGKRERDESDEDCLRRELREELGIEVEIKELVESLRHDYPEKTVHLKFFRCTWLRHEPKPMGCADMAWVDAAALDDYTFPEADFQLLKTLRREPELWKNAVVA